MLEKLFKVNEGKNILITIPNQKEKLNISLVGNTIEKNGLTIVTVKVNNRDNFKQLTDNIIKHYIDKEMKYHLKLYSIDNLELIYFEII